MPSVIAVLLCAVRSAIVHGVAFVAYRVALLKEPLCNRLIEMVRTKRSSATRLPRNAVLVTSFVAHINYSTR